jgi:putative FmdB family regulatory protein
MPLYEYECDSCGHRFERIQKFSDPPLTECPNCGQLVRKLMSSPAIQFMGTGWYITDYAKSGKPEKPQVPGKNNGDAAKSSEGGTSSTSGDSSKSTDSASSSSSSTEAPAAAPAKKSDSSET